LADGGFHPKLRQLLLAQKEERAGCLLGEVQEKYCARFCAEKGANVVTQCWGSLTIRKCFTSEWSSLPLCQKDTIMNLN